MLCAGVENNKNCQDKKGSNGEVIAGKVGVPDIMVIVRGYKADAYYKKKTDQKSPESQAGANGLTAPIISHAMLFLAKLGVSN